MKQAELIANKNEVVATEILKLVANEKRRLSKTGKYTNKEFYKIFEDTIEQVCIKRKCDVKFFKKMML